MTNEQIIKKFIENKNSERWFKNSGKTIFSEGPNLYSYGYHYKMARKYKNIVLVNAIKSSQTTERQKSIVKSLSPSYLEVPCLDVERENFLNENIKHFDEKIEVYKAYQKRARKEDSKKLYGQFIEKTEDDRDLFKEIFC